MSCRAVTPTIYLIPNNKPIGNLPSRWNDFPPKSHPLISCKRKENGYEMCPSESRQGQDNKSVKGKRGDVGND